MNAACHSGFRTGTRVPRTCRTERRIPYELTDPALHPPWGIGSRTRSWIPHGIHHVTARTPYDIPGAPHWTHRAHGSVRDPAPRMESHIKHRIPHEIPGISDRTPHRTMLTYGIPGPGLNLEWGSASRTTSYLPHGLSHGTPDPVRDAGSHIQSPTEPQIPSDTPDPALDSAFCNPWDVGPRTRT